MIKGATQFVERVYSAIQNRLNGKTEIAKTFVQLGFNALESANGATNRLVNAAGNFAQTIGAATLPVLQYKQEASAAPVRFDSNRTRQTPSNDLKL